MYSQTIDQLEKFDNQHDFERMCADILNALGYKDVVLIAPRGGGDGGRDITFTTVSGEKGLACVTLRKDIEVKFKQDFSQRKAGEHKKYVLFCTAYLTAKQKTDFIDFCTDVLHAELIPTDIEALRSLLDTGMQYIRQHYFPAIAGFDTNVSTTILEEAAQRIIFERPRFWELLLTVELLRTKSAPIQCTFTDLQRGVVYIKTTPMPAGKFLAWADAKMHDFSSLATIACKVINEEIPASWGQPGIAGDPAEIKRAVDKLIAICEGIVEWEEETRSIQPPPLFQPLKQQMEGWTGQFFAVLNTIPERILEVVTISQSPSAEYIEMKLHINSPQGITEFREELHRLQRAHPE